MMRADRRRHPRITRRVQGSWHRGAVYYRTHVANLSLGGCFVQSLDQTPPAGPFRLRLHPADGTVVWMTGEVTHFLQNQGFGVQFVDVNDTGREALSKAVDQLRTAPAGRATSEHETGSLGDSAYSP